MIRRILFTAAAAAALLAAAPAFAADTAPSKQQCSCCSDGSNHDVDHAMHALHVATKQNAAPRVVKSDADEVASGNTQGRG
jgi:hypothetical protein